MKFKKILEEFNEIESNRIQHVRAISKLLDCKENEIENKMKEVKNNKIVLSLHLKLNCIIQDKERFLNTEFSKARKKNG